MPGLQSVRMGPSTWSILASSMGDTAAGVMPSRGWSCDTREAPGEAHARMSVPRAAMMVPSGRSTIACLVNRPKINFMEEKAERAEGAEIGEHEGGGLRTVGRERTAMLASTARAPAMSSCSGPCDQGQSDD